MKKRIVAGNWKLYITDSTRAKKITSTLKRAAKSYSGVSVVLMPAAPLISTVSAAAGTGISVGSQTLSGFGEGAYTGYLSAESVRNAGATWTLIGHSEQRAREIEQMPAAGITDDMAAQQIHAAHAAGLSVMLCVGEVERDPQGAHFGTIATQLTSALKDVTKSGLKLAIAYEPVWAIGKSSSEAMKPADLEEMVIFIRKTLTDIFDRSVAVKIPILYGGSVDGTNVHDLLAQGGVAGFLVGRASTDAASFLEIIRAVGQQSR